MAATECFLLDVGQGMSSVIVIPGGRVIIVDGGPTAEVPLELLRRLPEPWTIEAIVVSHNDSDHARGISGIVRAYFERIRYLYVLVDRAAKTPWIDELIETLGDEEYADLTTNKLRRLETEDKRKVLWPANTPSESHDPRLLLLFPSFWDNRNAVLGSRPNDTSGVVELRSSSGCVLFPGDAPKHVWEQLVQRHGRLECDVLVYPHHGAEISSGAEDAAEWLLTDAVHCKELVVFSVGTRNAHGHPDARAVAAAARLGGRVACTQITPRCCSHPDRLAPGLMPPATYGERVSRSGMRPDGSKGVGCMGTVHLVLEPDRVLITDLLQHQQEIDGCKQKDWTPMCRPAPAPLRRARGKKRNWPVQ